MDGQRAVGPVRVDDGAVAVIQVPQRLGAEMGGDAEPPHATEVAGELRVEVGECVRNVALQEAESRYFHFATMPAGVAATPDAFYCGRRGAAMPLLQRLPSGPVGELL